MEVQRVADRSRVEPVRQLDARRPVRTRAPRRRSVRRPRWRPGRRASRRAAVSSIPCSDTPFAWICQPTKPAPSYSSRSAQRVTTGACPPAPGDRAALRPPRAARGLAAARAAAAARLRHRRREPIVERRCPAAVAGPAVRRSTFSISPPQLGPSAGPRHRARAPAGPAPAPARVQSILPSSRVSLGA